LASLVSSFRVSFTSHYPTPPFLTAALRYMVFCAGNNFSARFISATSLHSLQCPSLNCVSTCFKVVSVHEVLPSVWGKPHHRPVPYLRVQIRNYPASISSHRLSSPCEYRTVEQLCRPTYTAMCLPLSVRKCNLLVTGIALRRQY